MHYKTVSEIEWQTRVELAACYRLVDHYDMSDFTGTHISARVLDEENTFLLKQGDLFFHEVTASNLVKIHFDGRIIDGPDGNLNSTVVRAGYIIHSAILKAREDVFCALHTHTPAGMALSTMECGLLPITQHSLRYYNRISYHDYLGPEVDIDRCDALVADLGSNCAMILRNHGLLVAGRSISESLELILRLEKASKAQVKAMASGTKLRLIDRDVCEDVASRIEKSNHRGQRSWGGHLRILDQLDASYKE